MGICWKLEERGREAAITPLTAAHGVSFESSFSLSYLPPLAHPLLLEGKVVKASLQN